MELKPEQIEKFKVLHKGLSEFENYSDEEIRFIANQVANYYLTLYKIQQRINSELSKKL